MPLLNIITNPNDILRNRSVDIERDFFISDELKNLAENMIETMHEDDGIGLAAPQIGKNIRIITIGREVTPDKSDIVLINPCWIKLGRKKKDDVEGCLSIPKTFGTVSRYNKIEVSAHNLQGVKINFIAQDLFARVIQHEVDHLDGILFIDKAKDIYKTE